jgi:hypothetical protein
MGGEITYILYRDLWFWIYFGVKAKKETCIHTSSLTEGNDPYWFSCHLWRLKPTFVDLILMQRIQRNTVDGHLWLAKMASIRQVWQHEKDLHLLKGES